MLLQLLNKIREYIFTFTWLCYNIHYMVISRVAALLLIIIHVPFLSRKQDMLEILKDYGKFNITPAVVARVLGMMAQTTDSLPESVPYIGASGDSSRIQTKTLGSWDTKVLATALQALVSAYNYTRIIIITN